MKTLDVIVIGVGAMGGAALAHLARRGQRVLGIEQFDINHDRGSSHGDTRIIRRAYFEHPDYVPLVDRAYELWAELEAATGRRLLERAGLLMAGPPDGEIVPGVRRAAGKHGLNIVDVPIDELPRRFPGLTADDGMVALFEADAGFLRAEECVAAHVEQARSAGAEVLIGQRVQSWAADRRGVVVKTDVDTYSAGSLVLCGGAWTNRLLAEAGLPLEVRRKVVLWFATEGDRYRLERGFPVFGIETGGRFFYGFPEITPGEMKMADHTGGDVAADPDTIDRERHPADVGPVRSFAARFLPGVTGEVRRSSVCMYTMTPDGHFVVDRLPNQPNVFIAAGFSGHGFKFAPVIGSVLADLIIDGRTSEPVGFLSASRPGLHRRNP